jgi:hypothetical protein
MAQAIRFPFLRLLVERGTNLVRFDTLQMSHDLLDRHGFRLVRKERYGLGHQLFYVRGDALVRIKTHGGCNPDKPRFGQAHLTVSNWSNSLAYHDEWGKADATGLVRGIPSWSQLSDLIDIGAEERTRLERLAANAPFDFPLWAVATHFNFKVRHLHGAEHLLVEASTH